MSVCEFGMLTGHITHIFLKFLYMSIFYLLQISSAAINTCINISETGYSFLSVLHSVSIDSRILTS